MTILSPGQQAAAGWDVFPILANRKTDYAHLIPDGEEPGEAAYFHRDLGIYVRPTKWVNGWSRLAADGIDAFWPGGNCQHHNVGIATGHRSGVWVLDVDVVFEDEDQAREYAEEYIGTEVPPTFSVRTASGKWHFYYKMPENKTVEVKSSVGKLGPKIDVRGDGGMAMGVGSSVVNEDGERNFYEVVTMTAPVFAPLALLERVKREQVDRDEFAPASVEKDVDIAADALAQGWIEEELEKLRTLQRPWEPGAGWHMACFEVACQVLEFANSPWCATTPVEMFERYKQAAPSPDGSGWTGLPEWKEALKKTEGQGRAKPRITESMDWFDEVGTRPTEPQEPSEPLAPGETLEGPHEWIDVIDEFQDTDGSLPLAIAIRKVIPKRDGIRRLGHHDGVWYFYEGSFWSECKADDVSDFISRQLANAKIRTQEDDKVKVKPVTLTKNKVADVEFFLAGILRKREVHQSEDLVVYTRNGPVTVGDKERTHEAASPGVFNLSALPFDYDPTATSPNWDGFLSDLFEHDPAAAAALQEWFGYFLVGNPAWLQKMFWLIGPKRSGKGTILNVARALMGESATATALSELQSGFGRENLIGKRLAIIDDARDPDPRVAHGVVEFLLTLSSGGFTSVQRKHRRNWDGVLSASLFAASNTIPRLPDDGGAISSRLEVIKTRKSFIGHEDAHLTERLMTELPGILNWALVGLDRLRERERFTQAASARKVRDEVDLGATGATPFVRESLMLAPSADVGVLKKDIGEAMTWWARQQEDNWTASAVSIKNAIQAEFPDADGRQRVKLLDGSSSRSAWKGIVLKCHHECENPATNVSQISGPECAVHLSNSFPHVVQGGAG